MKKILLSFLFACTSCFVYAQYSADLIHATVQVLNNRPVIIAGSIFIPYSNSSQLSKVFLYDKNRRKLAYKLTRKVLTIKLPNNVDFGFAQMIKVTSSIKL